ncbi:MAG TPA: anthranilate synthase component I [Rhizomicrobium sp.]|jgi:anthranilate synthase component 1|nr:anthranilate synthase component I [Rhizomicrobium sp.]
MLIEPELAGFTWLYDSGQPQAVYTRLIADLETPVSVFLKIGDGRDHSFLFESVQGGETRGRYSVIGVQPDLIWRCRDGKAEINRAARTAPHQFIAVDEPPLPSLRNLARETQMPLPPDLPPMAVGLFGYLGYDMVRLIERLGPPPPDTLGLPDAILVRPTITAIFDNVRDEITLVTPVWPQMGLDARAAYACACERLNDTIDSIRRGIPASPDTGPPAAGAQVESNTTHADYLAMVERAKEYIRAGDIFQVVPSQRFRRPFTLPPFALYRALRRLNPSPFLYHLAFPGFTIVGSSPEILVRLRDGTVTIRPIAGTRRRGATPAEDAALANELMADPKERAEHLMLLDLGRNDVGRAATTGSVRVTDSFFIERYSHVMHLVSNVEGALRDGLDAVDALAAGLPAGTLSGAPKIRAMQIIDELEREKRGAAYAGAVGYFAANGAMDTCILLRTALIKDGIMYVQAGGGVVADSVPEAEYQESVNKAKALFAAADQAVQFAGGANG